MSGSNETINVHRKQLLARRLLFILAIILMCLVTVNAYKINPDQVSIISGEEIGSGSYTIIGAIGQSIVGEIVSSNYLLQIGWIATILNNKPVVGKIQVCDGSCSLTKTFDPATAFTVRVSVTDVDGQGDVNTESFRVSLYTASDINSSAESWDHNNMTLLDDNISLGTRNGCTQSGSIYCINIPNTAWTTKFLYGDANIYVAVDDNAHAFDANSMTTGGLTVNEIFAIAQDTGAGLFKGAAGTAKNSFESTQTSNSYIRTLQNGNADMNFNNMVSNQEHGAYVIGDDNIFWNTENDPDSGTPFTGGTDRIEGDWNRGVYPVIPTVDLYTWIDIPIDTVAGTYDGNYVCSTLQS